MTRYRDIDLSLTPHPITGDVSVVTDIEAVKTAIVNLVQLKRGDKPFHPEIGSGVRNLLFEPATSFTGVRISQEITRTINNYEPRASVRNVTAIPTADGDGYVVSIVFNIINRVEPINFTFALERLR